MKPLPVEYSLRAKGDLDETACKLDARNPGRGEEFVLAVRFALRHAAHFPEMYPEARPGLRRFRMRKFPYVVYYYPLPERIEVAGVLPFGHNPRAVDQF